MTEFIGVRAKMYTHKVMGKPVTKKIKGITGATTKTITFDIYYNCLLNNKTLVKNQYCIRSKHHDVYTTKQQKLALSPYDDKRVVNYVYTDTIPWGYIHK